MTDPYVTLQIENNIGTIEFFHPSHNSMPSDLLKELELTINKASSDDSIKVVVLKSGGDRAFCAGASFQELTSITNKEEGFTFFSGFANVINAMRNCSKIIIGRIQGKAVGGGVGLAASTDYCLATKHAAIKLSELNIGIGPFVIAPAVERKIGLSAFSQLTLDADTFHSPDWAQEKGLYNKVFEDVKQLDEAVSALANRLCKTNPLALQNLKSILWENTSHWDTLLSERAKISGELVLSPETKAALQKYTS